jgi:uncharacterized low-complexity protein
MKASKKSLAVVVGSAFVVSIATTSVYAAENPFAIKSLSSGYMVAEADASVSTDKPKDGKCGTGKCSAKMKKAAAAKASKDAAAGKAMEGSCSAEKAKEGSCHADKK